MRNFDFLFLFIIETTLVSLVFVLNLLSTFSISDSIMLLCVLKVVLGARWWVRAAVGWVQNQRFSISAVFPMSSEPSLCENRVIVCILNLLVLFGQSDVGHGLGTSTSEPCLGVLSHAELVFCWSMDLTLAHLVHRDPKFMWGKPDE